MVKIFKLIKRADEIKEKELQSKAVKEEAAKPEEAVKLEKPIKPEEAVRPEEAVKEPAKKPAKEMNISEMKKRIMEKIKEGKTAISTAESIPPSARPEDKAKEILKILKKPDEPKDELKPPASQEAVSLPRAEKEGAEDSLKKSLEEYRNKLANLEDRLKEKEGVIAGLERKAIEAKEQLEKIPRYEETLRAKDKRIAELDRLYKEFDTSKGDITTKLKLIEEEKNNLESKISQLTLENEAKAKRLGETDKLYEEIEDMVRNMDEKIGSSESQKKALESRILEKEKAEFALKNIVDGLKSDVETRDAKIASDIKYIENIIKELNALRLAGKKDARQ